MPKSIDVRAVRRTRGVRVDALRGAPSRSQNRRVVSGAASCSAAERASSSIGSMMPSHAGVADRVGEHGVAGRDGDERPVGRRGRLELVRPQRVGRGEEGGAVEHEQRRDVVVERDLVAVQLQPRLGRGRARAPGRTGRLVAPARRAASITPPGRSKASSTSRSSPARNALPAPRGGRRAPRRPRSRPRASRSRSARRARRATILGRRQPVEGAEQRVVGVVVGGRRAPPGTGRRRAPSARRQRGGQGRAALPSPPG